MQSEMKDNEKPVLDTPHFDDEEIAHAKPVQPLSGLGQRRTPPMPRMVSLVAMISAGLVVTAALAIGSVSSNSLLGSASDDDAASGEIATAEETTADASQDSSQRIENQAARDSKRRKFSTRRPQLMIRLDAGDDRRPKARLVSVIQ